MLNELKSQIHQLEVHYKCHQKHPVCLKLTKTGHMNKQMHLQRDYMYSTSIYPDRKCVFFSPILHVIPFYSININRKGDRNSKDATDSTCSFRLTSSLIVLDWFIIVLFQLSLEILQFHYLGFFSGIQAICGCISSHKQERDNKEAKKIFLCGRSRLY